MDFQQFLVENQSRWCFINHKQCITYISFRKWETVIYFRILDISHLSDYIKMEKSNITSLILFLKTYLSSISILSLVLFIKCSFYWLKPVISFYSSNYFWIIDFIILFILASEKSNRRIRYLLSHNKVHFGWFIAWK